MPDRADEGSKTRPQPGIRHLARNLRHRQTDTEARLWYLLRSRRFADFKFRRQVPVGRYIADFICYDARLIIELDGSQHLGSAKDVERDARLKTQDFRVLRVWNNEVFNNPESVLTAIHSALTEAPS